MRVLSSSPDATIRRLRAFAASIGGKAELVAPSDFDPATLIAHPNHSETTLLLIDGNTADGLAAAERLPATLPEAVNTFLLLFERASEKDHPQWASPSPIIGVIGGCSVASLEHPAVRCALGSFVKVNCAPDASSYLRWGYASSLWTPHRKLTSASALTEFMDKISMPVQSAQVHRNFMAAAEMLVPAGGQIVASLVATDGINCLSSVTFQNSNAILDHGIPSPLAEIDLQSGTIIALTHSRSMVEISLMRPVNGQIRGDGKSPAVRPATFIKMTTPPSQQDAAPTVRIVWTEAG